MKLEEMKRIAEAATAGPWGAVDLARATFCGFNNDAIGEPSTFEDARFIAMARTALPKLLAVAEAARSVLAEDAVREALSCYVMGVELRERLDALESEPGTGGGS